MAKHPKPDMHVPGFSTDTLSVQAELSENLKSIKTFKLGALSIDVCPGRDTIWVIVRRPGKGGIVLRTNPWPGPYRLKACKVGKTRGEWEVKASAGVWMIEVAVLEKAVLRVKMTLKPANDLLLTFCPRDLYILDDKDDPTQAVGEVEAAQRGVNGGICYFCVKQPSFGSVLYAQNLTALNPYFQATKTKPDGVVGGRWPSLGYQPPTSPQGYAPPERPLPAGEEIVLSDALLTFNEVCGSDEIQSAKLFVDLLARIYP